MFVGRTAELSELAAGIDEALSGRGRLFLIAGEPGIGKTRLADEVGALASARGAGVLWGRCWEGGGAPPYWPWMQVLRGCLRDQPPEARATRLGREAALLAQMLPELHSSDGDRLPGAPESEHARFQLFDATAQFLARVAAAQPLVLVLDDVHTADEPSLLLLQFVARELRTARILVIATYREAEVRRSRALSSLLAALAREGQRLLLHGLNEIDVRELVEGACQQTLPVGLMAALYRATDGNPFFVDEMTRTIIADRQGQKPPRGGELDLRVPDGVREAIRNRLALLAEETRGFLAVAAVIGQEFDLHLLDRIPSRPPVPFLETVREAAAAGLVRSTGSPGRFSFSHDLVRETLRAELPPTRRVQLHHEMAELLERMAEKEPAPSYATLAHHFYFAAPLSGAEKAVEYADRAGDQAMQQLAYEEAVRHYERALQAMDLRRSASSDPNVDTIRRCELLIHLGRAQRSAGGTLAWRTTFQRAAALAQQLLANGENTRAPGLLAQAALGFGRGSETGRVDEHVVSLLEQALAAIGPTDTELRSRLLARLAMAFYFSPVAERADGLSRDAVDIARRLGDTPTLLHGLIARHFILWGPTSVEPRLAVANEIIALCERAGDAELAMEGRLWRAADRMESGDTAGVRDEWAAFDSAAEALRLPLYRWRAVLLRAARALYEGRLNDAEDACQEALAMGGDAGIANAAQFFGVQLFQLRRQQGRLNELEANLQSFADQYPALPIWRCGLALLFVETDRNVAARRELERVAANDFADLRPDGNWLPALALLAEVCAATGDVERAQRLYELLLPHAERNVLVETMVVWLGPVAYYLGLLAATLQRPDRAVQHFEAAVEKSRGMGADLLAAQAQYGQARVLLCMPMSRNATEPRAPAIDAETGLELLAEVLVTARGLELKSLEEMAGALRQRFEPESPRPSSRAQTDVAVERAAASPAVFQREGDFWTVAFAGSLLRLKDSRGLFYLHQLLLHPQREFHVIDLVAATQGGAGSPSAGASRIGSELGIGPAARGEAILDDDAKAAYRRRLRELKDELEEAEEFNDIGRVERAQTEMDAITRELSAALGLGGRDRTAPSSAERARVAVTKAIILALKVIAEGNAPLRTYLGNTIKTGRFCSYTPDPLRPVSWQL